MAEELFRARRVASDLGVMIDRAFCIGYAITDAGGLNTPATSPTSTTVCAADSSPTTTATQRQAAIRAAAQLLLACVQAGWRIYELAPLVELNPPAARARISTARGRGDQLGISIPAPPHHHQRLASLVAVPLEQREGCAATKPAHTRGCRGRTRCRIAPRRFRNRSCRRQRVPRSPRITASVPPGVSTWMMRAV